MTVATAGRPPRLSDDLVSDIKVRMFWPTNGAPFTDAEILRAADIKLETLIYPLMMTTNPHVVTALLDIQTTNGGGLEHPGYRIPVDAMLQLVSVHWVEPNGHEEPLEIYTESEWLSTSDRVRGNRPVGCAIRGSTLVILPHPDTAQTGERIRLRYVPRPIPMGVNSASSGYGIITGVSHPGGLPTVGFELKNPLNPVPFSGQINVVTLSRTAPHVLLDNFNGLYTGGTTISLTIDQASQWPGSPADKNPVLARGGDIITRQSMTTVVQCPLESYDGLLDATCLELASARGDREAEDRFAGRVGAMMGRLEDQLRPRVAGQPFVLVNEQSPTHLRIRGRFRGSRR